jgi:glutamate---cysteine ligase / carboxylate-amine ligase
LAVPAEMQVTQTARFRQMLADYQLLAREQLICGTQVHVGVDDRDESVSVAHRVTPYLPTLLALSASSPFWADGSDTRLLQCAHVGMAALAHDGTGPVGVVCRRI